MKTLIKLTGLLILSVFLLSACFDNYLNYTNANLPVAVTDSISNMQFTSISCTGNITSDGGANIKSRGFCWSENSEPTINDEYIKYDNGTGSFTSVIEGLTPGTLYYIRAYATNRVGTAYGDAIKVKLGIGLEYKGGQVFYFLQPSDQGYDANVIHGLIAAPGDQGTEIEWGCMGTSISGTSSAIGQGSQNTAKIVSNCTTSGIAARICDELSEGGYSDWYLPSLDELAQLHLNKADINNLDCANYWSSTEETYDLAWFYAFWMGNNTKNTILKEHYILNVRCVRSF